MERSIFLFAVESALSISSLKESRRPGSQFAKQACLEWLSRWPGDFRVRAHLVDAYCLGEEFDSAVPQLQQVIEADPESVRPYRTLSALFRRIGRAAPAAEPEGCLFGLDALAGTPAALPEWADTLQAALHLMRAGRWQEARLSAETVLRAAPSQPLPAVVHLQALAHLAEFPVALSAGREYRKSWPGCAAILLLMAQSAIASGRNAEGVELLHAASVADPAGEVADRYLGSLNPYRSLWPQRMQLDLSIGLPAEVASAAGWNRLSSPPAPAVKPNLPEDIPVLKFPDFDSQHPENSPMSASSLIAPIPGEVFTGPSDASKNTKPAPAEESPAPPSQETPITPGNDLEDLRRQLSQVATRLRMKKTAADKDSRRPAYIVLTSRRLLASIYGPDLLPQIETCLQDVLRGKRSARGWSAYLVDVDNRESLQPLGLSPADPANAWQVKTLITDLDGALGKKGEMIGALLIVGGHEVIPFHLLPNPTDDDDPDVPSDNPYASRDENYFVPEWPVGRIPTPSDTHATFLLGVLRRIADASVPVRGTFLQNLISGFLNLLHAPVARFRNGSGLTAAVWQKASAEVFRIIGPTGGLLVCPPANSGNLPPELLAGAKYSYFNLHGMENGPQWLGQRDAKGKVAEDTEFPIVLLPSQVAGARKTPDVVFTEACYGANILKKGVGDSVSLEFLASGTRALVGSTKIAYGAASAPLIAADLLARMFLQSCLAGIPIGEALRQGKLAFAAEMNRRQDYLDPEDQKTLISFLLFGDPLHVSEAGSGKRADPSIVRWRKSAQPIRTLRTKDDMLENGTVPSENVQTSLKKAMHQYLPGMSDSRLRYMHPRFESVVETATSHGKKGRAIPRSPAWVVALDRKYEAHGQSLTQYAKISVDSSGHVIKVAVSR